MNTSDLMRALSQHRNGATVQAVTPSGTYTFEIVNVEGDLLSGPVLRLVEDVQVRLAEEIKARNEAQWWRNR